MKCYIDPNLTPKFITTVGEDFQSKLIKEEQEKGVVFDFTFTNIRAQPRNERMSNEMMRVLDIGRIKGIEIQNFEYTAAEKFRFN